VALAALRHRIALSADAQLDGNSADDLIRAVLDSIAAPRV
jgi:MoxR-like ATPase